MSGRRVEDQRVRWNRFRDLLDRVQRSGLKHLKRSELHELGRLYRVVASDLARARTDGTDSGKIAYLNDLVARGHSVVYVPPVSGWDRVSGFFVRDFPRVIIDNWQPLVAATLLFASCAIIGYLTARYAPGMADAIFPRVVGEQVYQRFQDKTWFNDPVSARPLISSAIFTNNLRVAAMAFAFGATLGAGTVFVLAVNGLMLGSTAAQFALHGHGLEFWATILPHGVIELTAICLAGGAGLLVAKGFLFPGEYRRIDSLVIAARRSARIIMGVALLLLVAGLIEGFYSTSQAGSAGRLVFAAASGVILFAYILRPLIASPDRRSRKRAGKDWRGEAAK